MCLSEYNEAEIMAMQKEEARQEGIHEVMLLNIKNLTDGMGWTAEKAMNTLKIPPNQCSSLYISLSKNA